MYSSFSEIMEEGTTSKHNTNRTKASNQFGRVFQNLLVHLRWTLSDLSIWPGRPAIEADHLLFLCFTPTVKIFIYLRRQPSIIYHIGVQESSYNRD